MVNEQLGDLIVLRAEPAERIVLAAHAAVDAVFPAKIGNLDHSPDEDLPPKSSFGGLDSASIKFFLSFAARVQLGGGVPTRFVRHAASKRPSDGCCNAKPPAWPSSGASA